MYDDYQTIGSREEDLRGYNDERQEQYCYYISPDQFDHSDVGHACALDEWSDEYLNDRSDALKEAQRLADIAGHEVIVDVYVCHGANDYEQVKGRSISVTPES